MRKFFPPDFATKRAKSFFFQGGLKSAGRTPLVGFASENGTSQPVKTFSKQVESLWKKYWRKKVHSTSIKSNPWCNKYTNILISDYLISFLLLKLNVLDKNSFFDRNFFLCQKLLSVMETSFCDGKYFLWQKLISVTETSFCHRNFFLPQ